jgi:hypothetical protein
VATPAEGTALTFPVAEVRGTTEPRATVTVGEMDAFVAANGSWVVQLPLGSGANVIRVVATDRAGNTATVSRNVTFTDPVPGLEADLSALQANLTAAQAAVASARAELDAAGANDTVSEARIAALEASLAANVATQARLEAQLAAMNQTVANMQRPAAPASEGTALIVALVGLVLGAAGLGTGVMASRRTGGGGMHAREKANKTKSVGVEGGGDQTLASPDDELRVKEKGNRTK